jgi:hypothetical protein
MTIARKGKVLHSPKLTSMQLEVVCIGKLCSMLETPPKTPRFVRAC